MAAIFISVRPTAASAGTLTGLGSQYIHFANIAVDSGAAWTLEWLSLPPLAAAAGGALKRAIRQVDAMSFAPVAP